MNHFSYNSGASKIEFGRDSFERVPSVVEACGATRALILSTEQPQDIAKSAADCLSSKAAGVLSGAVMHTPVEVTEAAPAYCQTVNADSIVSVGGDSTTRFGKAISCRSQMPHIEVPTTYVGSEVTPIFGTDRKQFENYDQRRKHPAGHRDL